MTTTPPIHPNDDVLYAGATVDETVTAGDRGDIALPEVPVVAPVVDTPAPAVDVVETPPTDTPEVETTPADEGDTHADPAVDAPVVPPVEEKPRNRKDFRDRLAAKNRKIEALQAQLDAQKAPAPVVAPVVAPAPVTAPATQQKIDELLPDLPALRLKSMTLLMEGKLEDAIAVQAQIDTAIYNQAAAQTAENLRKVIPQEIAARETERSLDEVVSELVTDYDVLDGDSDTYEPVTVAAINAAAKVLRDTGISPAQALRQAADQLLPKLHPELFEQAPAPVATPVVAPVVTPTPRRATPATAIANAVKQPPLVVPAQQQSVPTVDVFSLDDEQFNALSKETIRQLRGDRVL